MDTGTAIVIAALVPTATSLYNEWRASHARKILAKEVAENTRLTAETQHETKKTREEMNGMKDALIAAEKKISFAAGEASEAARKEK
jgi:hypothetical protein